MAKPTKVKYDESDDDECESDVCRNDDDEEEEYTKEKLMDMCEQVHTCFEMKRKECKELHKKVKSLEQSFDELNATHDSVHDTPQSVHWIIRTVTQQPESMKALVWFWWIDEP